MASDKEYDKSMSKTFVVLLVVITVLSITLIWISNTDVQVVIPEEKPATTTAQKTTTVEPKKVVEESPKPSKFVYTTIADDTFTVRNIEALINLYRVEQGLKPLTHSVELTRAAQAKADDELRLSYFSHTSPEGKTINSFINQDNYPYLRAGENLGVDFVSASTQQKVWEDSPSHNANMLSTNYSDMGVGISQGMFEGKQTTFVVVFFGQCQANKSCN